MSKKLHELSVIEAIDSTKNYCPLPWVHFHMSHNAETYPCCIAVINDKNSFGNLNSKTFDEVWHGNKLNQFRKDMLEDNRVSACYVCHLQEKLGEWSHRHDAIKKYHDKARPALATTDPVTGESPDAIPIFLDLRFSNICNMRCRMCGLYASSRWYNDAIALKKEYGTKVFVQEGKAVDEIVQITGIDDSKVPDLFNRLETYIPYMEEIYFAGGEPLITEEHYLWLDKLLKHNRNDIFIRYNTNLSKLVYKRKNVIDYWNQFQNIKIYASLDEMWKRAELIRKDTVWKEIEENLTIIKEQAPHVQLHVSCTVQNLNAFNTFEFHKYLVAKGFIGRKDFFYNILTNPTHKSIRILPDRDKEILTQIYINHMQWINEEYPNYSNETIQHTIDYMNNHPMDEFELRKMCLSHAQIDKLRNEDTRSLFPELSHIWEKYWPADLHEKIKRQ